MLTRIHINQHAIKANVKDSGDRPVITCKNYLSNTYAHEVEILDKHGEVVARVVYRPDQPLSCGARVWLECEGEVRTHLRETESAPATAMCAA